ncbi:MAG: hypothetical protein ACREQQ_10290, partial [Candidatus Binatia bacterium]
MTGRGPSGRCKGLERIAVALGLIVFGSYLVDHDSEARTPRPPSTTKAAFEAFLARPIEPTLEGLRHALARVRDYLQAANHPSVPLVDEYIALVAPATVDSADAVRTRRPWAKAPLPESKIKLLLDVEKLAEWIEAVRSSRSESVFVEFPVATLVRESNGLELMKLFPPIHSPEEIRGLSAIYRDGFANPARYLSRAKLRTMTAEAMAQEYYEGVSEYEFLEFAKAKGLFDVRAAEAARSSIPGAMKNNYGMLRASHDAVKDHRGVLAHQLEAQLRSVDRWRMQIHRSVVLKAYLMTDKPLLDEKYGKPFADRLVDGKTGPADEPAFGEVVQALTDD